MAHHRQLAAALAALGFAGAAAAQPRPAPVDPARLSEHVRVLASDAFEGRGPGTPGEDKAVDYIARQFAAAGLKPGGEQGGWYQAVPLGRFEITGPVRAELATPAGVMPLRQGEEIAVRAAQLPVQGVALANAPLVFVGYGVAAPERNWDDFKGLDVKGKVLVVLVNDPDFEAPPGSPVAGRFDGRGMTYYGRWTYKYEEAARRGAAGVLVVHETAPAAYGWATVKNSNTIPQFDIVRDDAARVHPLVEAWIQRDVAVELFRRAGLDFEAQKRAAESPDFRPVPLAGAGLSIAFSQTAATVQSRNVVGVLPGHARARDVVLYSAHWDHLGVGPPDASGDRIYHGAFDNASGVAGLIEIARGLAKGPPLARTVAFVATTAEEKNLLGAAYYAAHPLWPLALTVADLNLDGLSVNPARDVSSHGIGKNTLEDDLSATAGAEGRRFVPDPHPEEGTFFRADHFAFARAGVPAVTLRYGLDFAAGGEAAGEAWRAEYTAHRYHQPADKWSPAMDFAGGALDAGLYLKLGRDLAQSARWPDWKPGSEFKAVRDSSAAQRR